MQREGVFREMKRRKAYEKRSERKNREKAEAIRRASVLIMPSDCYENFPLAVAEANAWGVPALVPAHGGLQEMVVSGKTGEHFRPRNAQFAPAGLKQIPLVTIDQPFGGWTKAQATHFADGGFFDQLYKPGR